MRGRVLFLAALLLVSACQTASPARAARPRGYLSLSFLAERYGLSYRRDALTGKQELTGGTRLVVVYPGLDLGLLDQAVVRFPEGPVGVWEGEVFVPPSLERALRGTVARSAAPKPAGPPSWEPRVASRPWRYIVIHHSATVSGGASKFNRIHLQKGWDGLGYHFVIGNGTETKDGEIEVGWRWPVQREGAHAKGDPLRLKKMGQSNRNAINEEGIGVCLVGNFDVMRPTAAQMASLKRLVTHLMRRYRIPKSRVLRHGDVKSTHCPGRNFPCDAFLRSL